MTLYTHESQNVRKTWILMSLFLIVVIALGWLFSYIYDDLFILYFAIGFSIIVNLISYWESDKIVLKISGAVPVNRREHFNLFTTVENLSIAGGLPMPKVYIINDNAPNAFATGRNKEKAVIVVTTGLLKILDKTELEGVIAHELSHIGNRDILLATVVVILVGFIAMLSDLFLRFAYYGGGGRRRSSGGGQLGLIIFIAGIVLAILSPLIASLIHMAISRKREFLADASGALLTRYPEGLASALKKIGAYSAPMRRANNATAHLFISNPFGGREGRKFMHRIFSTHPPINDRINALMGGRGI